MSKNFSSMMRLALALSLCVQTILSLDTLAMAAGNTSASFAQGITAYRQNRYEEALLIFESLHHREPGNYTVSYYLAITLARLGHTDRARSLYESIIRSRPNGQLYEMAKEGLMLLPGGGPNEFSPPVAPGNPVDSNPIKGVKPSDTYNAIQKAATSGPVKFQAIKPPPSAPDPILEGQEPEPQLDPHPKSLAKQTASPSDEIENEMPLRNAEASLDAEPGSQGSHPSNDESIEDPNPDSPNPYSAESFRKRQKALKEKELGFESEEEPARPIKKAKASRNTDDDADDGEADAKPSKKKQNAGMTPEQLAAMQQMMMMQMMMGSMGGGNNAGGMSGMMMNPMMMQMLEDPGNNNGDAPAMPKMDPNFFSTMMMNQMMQGFDFNSDKDDK